MPLLHKRRFTRIGLLLVVLLLIVYLPGAFAPNPERGAGNGPETVVSLHAVPVTTGIVYSRGDIFHKIFQPVKLPFACTSFILIGKASCVKKRLDSAVPKQMAKLLLEPLKFGSKYIGLPSMF